MKNCQVKKDENSKKNPLRGLNYLQSSSYNMQHSARGKVRGVRGYHLTLCSHLVVWHTMYEVV